MMPSLSTQKPNLKSRLAAAKTAYFTVSKGLSKGNEESMLQQVRKAFSHLRIGAYAGEFESSEDWRSNFGDYIADVDVLIVGIDSTRLTSSGVLWEIGRAREARTLIILFKLDDDQPRPYYGYSRVQASKGRMIRFTKRAEKLAWHKANAA